MIVKCWLRIKRHRITRTSHGKLNVCCVRYVCGVLSWYPREIGTEERRCVSYVGKHEVVYAVGKWEVEGSIPTCVLLRRCQYIFLSLTIKGKPCLLAAALSAGLYRCTVGPNAVNVHAVKLWANALLTYSIVSVYLFPLASRPFTTIQCNPGSLINPLIGSELLRYIRMPAFLYFL